MKKIKISQIQFEAKSTPVQNSIILKSFFNKTKKYKPDLICTPECSNIITGDKKYLLHNVNFENECPILKMAKEYAKENNANINIGSLLLKKRNSKKLINRSFLINEEGKIVKKSMIRSGINTLIIGGIAAIVAYLVGYGLNFLIS